VPTDELLLTIPIHIATSYMDLTLGITTSEDLLIEQLGIGYSVPNSHPGTSTLTVSHRYGTTTKDHIGLPSSGATKGVSRRGTDDYIYIAITVYIPIGNRPARIITRIIPQHPHIPPHLV